MSASTEVVRSYFPGMGEAVADRTINRKIFTEDQKAALPKNLKLNSNDPLFVSWKNAADMSAHPVTASEQAKFMSGEPELRTETWGEVAKRVAAGNTSLVEGQHVDEATMYRHLAQGSLLMSGRHLQHGDQNQKSRPMEVFTNCGRYDTEVITLEKGVVKLGDVVGETLSVRTADGEWRPAMFNQHGEQKLYEMTFVGKNGRGARTVHFTRDHRWLLKDGTITTNIQIGDTLMPMPVHNVRDPEAVVHGLIFGDGTAHKGRRDHGRPGVSVGRTYASIRVCKSDAVRDEIHAILDAADYHFTTPRHSDGDRVYYLGKIAHAKELPFNRDPDYIAGFIYGWWLADGHKAEPNGTWTISTADSMASDWLIENSVIAGLSVVSNTVKIRKPGDGSYANGKNLNVVRLREGVEWKLSSIIEGDIEVVYCPEEPVSGTFTLANGLLTGNCSTAASTFLLFYLLLNGSGVGRAYDDAMMNVDWTKAPNIEIVIDGAYPDRSKMKQEWNGSALVEVPMVGTHFNEPDAVRALAESDQKVTWFEVPDSRGGWAKALEIAERMAFEGRSEETLVLDFSKVRPHGSPIKGMQNRPSSGPGPLMNAIYQISQLKGLDIEPWEAAMRADHYAAECVLVGGARRAARMATKRWDDETIFDFIAFKRGGGWWSSNNSVTIDDVFRELCGEVSKQLVSFGRSITDVDFVTKLFEAGAITEQAHHAWRVLHALADASYFDGTGEPGLINQDRLHENTEGVEQYIDGLFAGSKDFQLDAETIPMMRKLFLSAMIRSQYSMITNPCGEIALLMLGGYCVIADVVPFHAQSDADAEEAFRVAVRALIRTNTMDSLYSREVKRTNRIGVGMTGLHEWIYSRFGFTWHDIVNEQKSMEMWLMLSKFKRAIVEEAKSFSALLGVVCPHTDTTMKPAGTTSKLFGVTEGAHLPSRRWLMRWVQFRNDDPLIQEYLDRGYPVRHLEQYAGTTIVGFPTAPAICELGDGEWIVTAGEATPEDQYQFLRLMEKYWIVGVEEDGVTPLSNTGNQISYTLKYKPEEVNFERFMQTLIDGQFSVRCCSVMPQIDTSAYEYQPEEPITHQEYLDAMAKINTVGVKEDIGFEHVDCGTAGCPIDFK
jgi:ribonucleoside-triphosphate reductase (formate)